LAEELSIELSFIHPKITQKCLFFNKIFIFESIIPTVQVPNLI
jgi:hypothetical protein